MLWACENGAIIDIIGQLSPLAFIMTVTSVLGACVCVCVRLDLGKEENTFEHEAALASLPGVRNQGTQKHINSQGLLTVTSYKIGSAFSLAVVLSSHI